MNKGFAAFPRARARKQEKRFRNAACGTGHPCGVPPRPSGAAPPPQNRRPQRGLDGPPETDQRLGG